MKEWVVAYDCGEAEIVAAPTREEAGTILDDLGCHPVAVYAPGEVYLKTEPWICNGQLRCSFVLREVAR